MLKSPIKEKKNFPKKLTYVIQQILDRPAFTLIVTQWNMHIPTWFVKPTLADFTQKAKQVWAVAGLS